MREIKKDFPVVLSEAEGSPYLPYTLLTLSDSAGIQLINYPFMRLVPRNVWILASTKMEK
jgi:hypothetical protein